MRYAHFCKGNFLYSLNKLNKCNVPFFCANWIAKVLRTTSQLCSSKKVQSLNKINLTKRKNCYVSNLGRTQWRSHATSTLKVNRSAQSNSIEVDLYISSFDGWGLHFFKRSQQTFLLRRIFWLFSGNPNLSCFAVVIQGNIFYCSSVYWYTFIWNHAASMTLHLKEPKASWFLLLGR